MGIVTVREFNANISKVLARIEAGETIDISKNGVVIAELRPKQNDRMNDRQWREAYEATLAFMQEGLNLGIGKVTMQDKYGDDA